MKLRVVQIEDSKLAPIFEVVARPNEGERSLHRASREKTGESSSFAPVRRKFWQRYLELFPEDAALGVKASAAPAQWMRASQDHDFNVSIYRATTGVGVFLRGLRGTSAQEMQARLSPHADRFVELAGNVNKIGSTSSHTSDAIDINITDENNWDQAIQWLHDRGHAFLDAAVQVFECSA